MEEPQITAKQRMRSVQIHLGTLQDDIGDMQNEYPQSFICSDASFKIYDVRENLAKARDLLEEIYQEL